MISLKRQTQLFDIIIILTYIIYFSIYVGLYVGIPTYLIYINFFIKVYVSAYLVYRFNPFIVHQCGKLDRKIAYYAGWFILLAIISDIPIAILSNVPNMINRIK